MILFPLGPKGKLPDLPLMTFAVGLCTIAFSIYSFKSLDSTISRTMKHEGYRYALTQADELATKFCEAENVVDSECSKLKTAASGLNLFIEDNLSAALFSHIPMQEEKVEPPLLFSTANKEKLAGFSRELFGKLNYSSEWRDWTEHVTKTYERGHWLTTQTHSAISVMKSQFVHGGWIHLVTNMIFFFAFAGALEMRLGLIGWVFVYLAGSAAGMMLHTISALPPGVPLVGASAGISALAGAYLVLFWRHPTRVLFNLFGVYNEVLLIPTSIFVLVMLVSQDLVGLSVGGSTAHLAHLGGLGFGVTFAILFKQSTDSDSAFLYPHEQEAFNQAQYSKEALAIYDQILVWNPENTLVRDRAFHEVFEARIPEPARVAFLKLHLGDTLERFKKDNAIEGLCLLCRHVSEVPRLTEIIKSLSPDLVLFVVKTLADTENELALGPWAMAAAKVYPQLKRDDQFRMISNSYSQVQKMGGGVSA